MSKLSYWQQADKFKQKILAIPKRIEEVNDKVDFSSGRPQEIMIDLESMIEDLENEFFLYSEEVEKLLPQK